MTTHKLKKEEKLNAKLNRIADNLLVKGFIQFSSNEIQHTQLRISNLDRKELSGTLVKMQRKGLLTQVGDSIPKVYALTKKK